MGSLLVSFLFFVTMVNGELNQVLKLRDGTINGTVGKSKNGRSFRIFYGIPYAEPPIGDLRFQAPVPVKPWSGTKNTTVPPPVSVQPHFDGSIVGQEDCLYLNVFTPINSHKESAKAPVIVFIHGGEFQFGDGASNNPEYFMDWDVVLVTINYRLGVLGFLSMNNNHISGNFGMKDQALALKWIKDNIAAFGGDPDNVTLMGESAGAVSVHLHMFSPLSKGLFHKAIMQSGAAFSTWSFDKDIDAEAAATSFIVSSGCFSRDPLKVLQCLKRIPAEELIATEKLLCKANEYSTSILFKPSIESKVTNQPFLPQKPTKTGYLTDVPWLTGINTADGAFAMNRFFKNQGRLFQLLNNNRKYLFPRTFDYRMIAKLKHWDTITHKLVDFYFGSKDICTNTTLNLVQLLTDSLFMFPMMKSLHSSHIAKYVYLYDHRGSFSVQQFMPDVTVELGVCHSDELPLLFRNENFEAKWTPQDKLVSNTLLTNWINFATFGDPNGPSPKKLWKPVETDAIEYFHIKSDASTMERNLLKKRYEFWKSLPLVQNL